MTGIISGFAGLIDTWDVINESLDASSYDNLEADWVTAVGPVVAVSRSLSWARGANPSGFFLVNDFVTADSYRAEVAQIVASGRTPSAVGIQSHMHSWVWPDLSIQQIYDRFAVLNLPIHMTEMTIISGSTRTITQSYYPDWPSTAAGEASEAADVLRFYRLLFSQPNIRAITWWDFSDAGAWLGAPAGLTRSDMSSKPAYNVLMKLIHDEWWTNSTVATDSSGAISFRGFYGRHRLRVGERTAVFDIASGAPANLDVIVR